MTSATILEFVNHEELAIPVIKYNFPPWGHWHFIINLIRAGDDSTRIPSAIVETLLEFGTMWIHLGNPMVFDEASWRIAVGIETGSKGSVTCIVLIKCLHFRVTPLVGRSNGSPIFFTIYSPIWRQIYGRSGATLVVIIIDEWTVSVVLGSLKSCLLSRKKQSFLGCIRRASSTWFSPLDARRSRERQIIHWVLSVRTLYVSPCPMFHSNCNDSCQG